MELVVTDPREAEEILEDTVDDCDTVVVFELRDITLTALTPELRFAGFSFDLR